MKKQDYAKERLDSRWQKKRLEILGRDDFKCRECDNEENNTLNVHHAYYVKGRRCWEYPSFSLSTLCSKCHKDKHAPAEEEGDWLEEWEVVFKFITGDDPLGTWAAWKFATQIEIAAKAGYSRRDIFDTIVKSLLVFKKEAIPIV